MSKGGKSLKTMNSNGKTVRRHYIRDINHANSYILKYRKRRFNKADTKFTDDINPDKVSQYQKHKKICSEKKLKKNLLKLNIYFDFHEYKEGKFETKLLNDAIFEEYLDVYVDYLFGGYNSLLEKCYSEMFRDEKESEKSERDFLNWRLVYYEEDDYFDDDYYVEETNEENMIF